MIRCVRIWTAKDGNSQFKVGSLAPGAHGDLLSDKMLSADVSFQEAAPGGKLEWHTAPRRQFVVILAGTLDFETRDGAHFHHLPWRHTACRTGLFNAARQRAF